MPIRNLIARLGKGLDAVRGFLRWWGAELGALAMEGLEKMAPRWRRSVLVFADRTQLRFTIPGTDLAATVPLVDSGVVPDELSALRAQGRRVRLIIDESMAFIQTLSLPRLASGHLRSAVALQLPALMPIKLNSMATSLRQVPGPADSTQIAIEVAGVRRSDFERCLERVRSLDFVVTQVGIAEEPGAPNRFALEIPDRRGRTASLTATNRRLALTAAALGVVCFATAAAESLRAQYALEQAQRQIAPSAATALSRRNELVARAEPLAELSRTEASPDATRLLTDLTTAIPQNTWLTSFELKSHSLRLVGISPDPAAIVRFLNSLPALTNVELRSSMSVGIGTGKDRFEIVAEISTPRSP